MRVRKQRRFSSPESASLWDISIGESIQQQMIFFTLYMGDASVTATRVVHKSVAAEIGRYLLQLAGESE